MTNYYEVGLAAVFTINDQNYRIIHLPSVLKFKNLNDAQDYHVLVSKLQQKKNIFPTEINGFPLTAFTEETAFFTVGELDQVALKKKWIKSKLDPEELIDLGLTP